MARIELCPSSTKVSDPGKGIPAQTVRCVRNKGHKEGAPGSHMGLAQKDDGTTEQQRWS